MLNKLTYCFKTALQSIRQHILLNLITATTISITFIIFISFLLLMLNLSTLKKSWVEQLHIICYMQDSITAEQTKKIKDQINAQPEVTSAIFVSSTEALSLLKQSLKGQDGILEGLSDNPLPASFEVELKQEYMTIEGVETFVAAMRSNKHISDIEYGQKWLERFVAFFEITKITGFILGGFLFIFTLFIISNTIKLVVYNRRSEIEIMKLVGASSRLIKTPYCIEGIIQGMTGAVCALIFLYLAVNVFVKSFISSLQFFFGTNSFVFLDLSITLYVLILGALLGFAGSLLSLNSLEELQL
ncbi:MAG: ABC transporter permease [Deltaproteobacteria bacterium]|nr:ABC transporter permease [Deltaproteobacteria bacterium]